MLAQERFERILEILREKQSVTVTDLTKWLNTSESTIRRDLTELNRQGLLIKVHGGATAVKSVLSREEEVITKAKKHQSEKRKIGEYAASLINKEDMVYLDAGTTTGYMLEYPLETSATFVTNAVSHARKLAVAGYRVLLVGGELRGTTEAVVGAQAVLSLQEYHFTVGFFGTNGLSRRQGYTTPDGSEALVKKTALRQCAKAYVLADRAKFDEVSSVTFAAYSDAKIITDSIPEHYKKYGNIIQV